MSDEVVGADCFEGTRRGIELPAETLETWSTKLTFLREPGITRDTSVSRWSSKGEELSLGALVGAQNLVRVERSTSSKESLLIKEL